MKVLILGIFINNNSELKNEINYDEKEFDADFGINIDKGNEERMKYEFEKDNPYIGKTNYLEIGNL